MLAIGVGVSCAVQVASHTNIWHCLWISIHAAQCTTLYNSEIAPAKLRGALNILFQLMVTIGILVSQLINYGTQHLEWGWRLSLGIAFVPAFILFMGALPKTLPKNMDLPTCGMPPSWQRLGFWVCRWWCRQWQSQPDGKGHTVCVSCADGCRALQSVCAVVLCGTCLNRLRQQSLLDSSGTLAVKAHPSTLPHLATTCGCLLT